MCVCVCVCERERERESQCVCVCVCVREKQTGRQRTTFFTSPTDLTTSSACNRHQSAALSEKGNTHVRYISCLHLEACIHRKSGEGLFSFEPRNTSDKRSRGKRHRPLISILGRHFKERFEGDNYPSRSKRPPCVKGPRVASFPGHPYATSHRWQISKVN